MAGIVFLKSACFTQTLSFYTTVMEMSVWIEQPDITILRHENLLVGFQDAGSSAYNRPGAGGSSAGRSVSGNDDRFDPTRALLTFFYRTRDETDAMYRKLSKRALSLPKENAKYRIYNFYFRDPEDRLIECQTFLHELPAW